VGGSKYEEYGVCLQFLCKAGSRISPRHLHISGCLSVTALFEQIKYMQIVALGLLCMLVTVFFFFFFFF